MPWLPPWGSPPPPKPQTTQEHIDHHRAQLQSQIRDIQKQDAEAVLSSLNAQLSQLPPYLLLVVGVAAGVAVGVGSYRAYVRYLKRLPNGEWVTPDMTERRRWIKGYVTKVADPDNFRLYHTPGIGWAWPLRVFRIPAKVPSNQTLSIRVAGVDAPELSHFGKPEQPFAQESLQWLKGKVEGKIIYCQLLQRDQYKRIVAAPYFKPRILPGWLFRGKSLGLEMLRQGQAAMYKETAAVYGNEGEEAYLRLEKQAQEARKGMWQNGIQELPSEYKRRHRDSAWAEALSEEDDLPVAQKVGSSRRSKGWLSRIFGR